MRFNYDDRRSLTKSKVVDVLTNILVAALSFRLFDQWQTNAVLVTTVFHTFTVFANQKSNDSFWTTFGSYVFFSMSVFVFYVSFGIIPNQASVEVVMRHVSVIIALLMAVRYNIQMTTFLASVIGCVFTLATRRFLCSFLEFPPLSAFLGAKIDADLFVRWSFMCCFCFFVFCIPTVYLRHCTKRPPSPPLSPVLFSLFDGLARIIIIAGGGSG
jgi:hypothetical protein